MIIIKKCIATFLFLGLPMLAMEKEADEDKDLVKYYLNLIEGKYELLINHSLDRKEIKALAKAIKSNSTLKMLSLSKNQISNDGAASIAEALKKNSTLTELWLYDNKIGDHGAIAIARALKENFTLKYISLDFMNVISKDILESIENLCVSNRKLALFRPALCEVFICLMKLHNIPKDLIIPIILCIRSTSCVRTDWSPVTAYLDKLIFCLIL